MPEHDPTTALAHRLLDGVAALRDSRLDEAIPALHEVASSPALAQAADLQDIRARASTLLAQALLDASRLDEALPWLDLAQQLIESLGDAAGLAEVQSLRHRRNTLQMEALRHKSTHARLQALAQTSLEDLRAHHEGDPVGLAETLIRKANAEVEAGRPEIASQAAAEALQLARATWSTRAEVMARLSLARAAPDQAQQQLTEAWRAAERADEHTLVTAVARAAEAAGLTLPETLAPFADKDPT